MHTRSRGVGVLLLACAAAIGCQGAPRVKQISLARQVDPERRRQAVEANRLGLAESKPDRALEHFERAIELDPWLADAYNNRGLALQKLERYDEAARQFERASQLAPRRFEPDFNLGNLLLDVGLPDKAVAHYERALAKAPRHLPLVENALVAYQRLGAEPAKSLPLAERALVMERRPEWRQWLLTLRASLAAATQPAGGERAGRGPRP